MWTPHPTLPCQVNEQGQIRTYDAHHKKWVVRKSRPNKLRKNYLYLWIGDKSVAHHRVVAETLIPNPENKPTVNHKDGDKNNIHPTNLEWATYKENNEHAVRIGSHTNFGQKAIIQCTLDGTYITEFTSILQAANTLQLDRRAIQRVLDGTFTQTHGFKFIYKREG